MQQPSGFQFKYKKDAPPATSSPRGGSATTPPTTPMEITPSSSSSSSSSSSKSKSKAAAAAARDHPKFWSTGRARDFGGNTIVCHLPQQGEGFPIFDTFLDVYRDLRLLPFYHKLVALPPSSYHMTMFSGANDTGRSHPGRTWPNDIPTGKDTTIDQCTQILCDRLRTFPLDIQLPIRMVFDGFKPGPVSVFLKPLDSDEEAKLRFLRVRLGHVMGIPVEPGKDGYKFHLTIAYNIDKLDANESKLYVEAVAGWTRMIAERKHVILLDAPEFCSFRDMFAFRTLVKLQ
eukprot:TRINITY_DN5669_c0_g1_i3.p1 TRINITY_DN5669_c0_g1~~TRINITY_DN5669_c0_g1_i3.p1  ORF type:complete len:297 (+),score=36.37 TRINITY_DN5669_c0_g1_i3:29-892(+)